MPITLKLFVGTLKIKRYAHLRYVEQKRLVPSVRFGKHHLIWWSRASDKLYKTKA